MDSERQKLLDHIESKKEEEHARKVLEDIRHYLRILNDHNKSSKIDGIEALIDKLKERK